MHITLIDTNESIVHAWKDSFADCSDVTVMQGDITVLEIDAIVSPANSFGFMDGGVDHAISQRLGWDFEKEVQKRIRALPEGELLVGTALVVETGDERIPFLISAPTMRIPTNFNIDTSVNAYLAMKAVLIRSMHDERINTVACPGLCTGVGGMKPVIAAIQMFKAYEEIVQGKRMNFETFGQAQKYQLGINPESMIWTH